MHKDITNTASQLNYMSLNPHKRIPYQNKKFSKQLYHDSGL